MAVDELDKPRDALFSMEELPRKNNYFKDWLVNNRSKYVDKSDAIGHINKLLDLMKHNDADLEDEKSPYYNFLIAYAYSWNNEPTLAESRARIAEMEFFSRRKYLQSAVSGWLLGLLQCKHGKPEHALAKLNHLDEKINNWISVSWRNGEYQMDYNDLHTKIMGSSGWILKYGEKFEREKEKRSEVSAEPDKKDPPNPPDSRIPETISPGNNFYPLYLSMPLVVENPKDSEILKRFRNIIDEQLSSDNGPKPKPYPEENPPADPVPVGPQDGPQEPSKPSPKPGIKRIIIPQFPLEGPVAAGFGEPHLHTSREFIGPVDSDYKVNINGIIHFVTVIFSKPGRKIDGDEYAWLKVVGESMNAAKPTPINNGDYILFRKISNLESYVREIVISELEDDITQPAQIVVKRLIKRVDKYYLHSESSYDHDPLTGNNYLEDVEIVRNNQVGGVVIAIAKPETDQDAPEAVFAPG
jgi:hypothetical protein